MDKMLLKENRWMDDVLFPINAHRFVCTPDDNIFTCHWHDELEFLMIRSGIAQIQVGTEDVTVSAGEALLINSGELHAGFVPAGGDGFSFTAIVFHPSMLYGSGVDAIQTRYLDPVLKGGLPPLLHIRPETPWGERALVVLTDMDELLAQREAAFEFGVKGQLFNAFHHILSGCRELGGARQPTSTHSERMKQVLTHIRDHYRQRLTIGELSKLAGFSQGHFCAFFRRMTGTTFIDYLNRYRVSQAADMLRESDRKILDIAMEVGFENASYFIVKFKKYMRCTPHEWRVNQT